MVHESAAAGYQQESATYAKARPAYHPDLIDRFVDRYGQGTVVDLGAGTGIFTRQLVDHVLQPIAIEPVAAMRAVIGDTAPSVQPIDGTAEATGLADASVDTVAVAQAFHWFDHGPALVEIRRILRPGGHLVCLWNVRDETVPWVRAYSAIVNRHADNTPRHHTMEWRQAIDADADLHLVDDFAIDNPKPSNPDAVAARARSTSFIAALDPAAQRAVTEEILQLTRPFGDTFVFPYRSELQAWSYEPATAATN